MKRPAQCEQTPWSAVHFPPDSSESLVRLCPWSDPAVCGKVQGELHVVSQHPQFSLCNMVK